MRSSTPVLSPAPSATSGWRWLGRTGSVVVLAVLLVRSSMVDVFAIVTNDSLGYLSWADAGPLSQGAIVQGYRQIGYPAFLWVTGHVTDVLGLDRLFGISLVQRGLLALGVAVTWARVRWWSLPALFVMTAATVTVTANMVLTEGLQLPLMVLVAVLLVHLASRHPVGLPATSMLLVAALTTSLVFLKLQNAALLLPTTAAIAASPAPVSRRTRIWVVAAMFAVVGALGVAQAAENHRELGVFEPVSESARAAWYGAYQAIFRVDPGNRSDPALAEFRARGDLYAFLHGLEAREGSYRVRRQVIGDRIERMFDVAGTSTTEQHVRALWGALRGGRSDDLEGLVSRMVGMTRDAADEAITPNRIGAANGHVAVLQAVNRGEATTYLETSTWAAVVPGVLHDHRPLKQVLFLGSFLVCLASLLTRSPLRYVGAGVALAVLAIAAALSMAYIDNSRYLVPIGMLQLIVASAVLRDLAGDRLSRAVRGRRPRRSVSPEDGPDR